MEYRVKHKVFGEGIVKNIDRNRIEIQFGNQRKKFLFPQAFGSFLVTEDNELLEKIQKYKDNVYNQNIGNPIVNQHNTSSNSFSHPNTQHEASFCDFDSRALLGNHSQTIAVNSASEMFDIVGYIANPRHVSSIEAEVPKDGRDKVFEKLFPGQRYRPIEMGNTPSGLPNKISSQFRINFIDLSNCPAVLRANMRKGNGGCVGRINKSRFVLTLVQKYGFKFGDRQDINYIRAVAQKHGYLVSVK